MVGATAALLAVAVLGLNALAAWLALPAGTDAAALLAPSVW